MYTDRRRAAQAAHALAPEWAHNVLGGGGRKASAADSSVCSGLLYGPHWHGDADSESRGVDLQDLLGESSL